MHRIIWTMDYTCSIPFIKRRTIMIRNIRCRHCCWYNWSAITTSNCLINAKKLHIWNISDSYNTFHCKWETIYLLMQHYGINNETYHRSGLHCCKERKRCGHSNATTILNDDLNAFHAYLTKYYCTHIYYFTLPNALPFGLIHGGEEF